MNRIAVFFGIEGTLRFDGFLEFVVGSCGWSGANPGHMMGSLRTIIRGMKSVLQALKRENFDAYAVRVKLVPLPTLDTYCASRTVPAHPAQYNGDGCGQIARFY